MKELLARPLLRINDREIHADVFLLESLPIAQAANQAEQPNIARIFCSSPHCPITTHAVDLLAEIREGQWHCDRRAAFAANTKLVDFFQIDADQALGRHADTLSPRTPRGNTFAFPASLILGCAP